MFLYVARMALVVHHDAESFVESLIFVSEINLANRLIATLWVSSLG